MPPRVRDKVGVYVYLDEDVYRMLRELVRSKYDSLRGGLSREVNEALRHWLSQQGYVTPSKAQVDKQKTVGGQKPRRKATMLDVIRERKVQLLSEIEPRNPERYVAKARELGIVVVEGVEDTALVDPDAYREFTEKLREVDTFREEEVLRRLGDPAMQKLFSFMRENGLIYFDSTKQRWEIA